jgi:hypothetical protein
VGAHLAWMNKNDAFNEIMTNTTNMRNLVALLVEPQPHIAAQLQDASKNMPHMRIEHAAVCATPGNVTFYSVTQNVSARTGIVMVNGSAFKLPHWTSQVGAADLDP